MGENKKYYWLKLKEDFFRDKEIKKLRRIAGGDTYTIIYLKLQLLSLKKEGKLIFDNLEDSFAEEMALEIDEATENVKITLMYLQKCGLLEDVAENEFILPQAIKSIGNETQGAERVRKHRENKKALQSNTQPLLSNTTVTKCNTEIELEKEKDIYIDKIWSLYPNKKGKASAIKSIPKLLKSIGYEKLESCIQKYIKENKKTDIQYIQHGSTFFNSGYMDYLDIDSVIKPKLKIEIIEAPYEY